MKGECLLDVLIGKMDYSNFNNAIARLRTENEAVERVGHEGKQKFIREFSDEASAKPPITFWRNFILLFVLLSARVDRSSSWRTGE